MMECGKKVWESLRASMQTGRRALAMLLSCAVLLCTLPVAQLSANAAGVSNNPGFRVIAYDKSARIEIPYVSGATNYKVYLSTDQNADIDALNADTRKQKVFDSGYESYAYAVDGDNNISISPSTPYYFYLVTDGTLQSTFQANTRAAADCYWTSPGVYDSGWYAGHENDTSYTISTAAQLAGLAVLVNGLYGLPPTTFSGKTVKLTASVDLSAYLWTPIGIMTDSYIDIPFSGIFDGGNHVVSGLHINDGTKMLQGLFGDLVSPSSGIKNIGVVNGYVKGSSNVGGVVGGGDGETDNCYNTGTVIGTDFVGGVAGGTQGNIRNCYNTGTVSSTGDFAVGGIVGLADDHYGDIIIDNCHNTGAVIGKDSVAGVAGAAYGTIKNCYNTGIVIGTDGAVSGVVGTVESYGRSAEIINCYNAGVVNGTGANYVGGILAVSGEPITNCYNTGSISGNSNVGGVVGDHVHPTAIKNSYSAGKVNSSETDIYYGASGNTATSFTDISTLLSNINGGNAFCAAPTQYAAGGVFSSASPVNQGFPVLKAFGYTGDNTSIETQMPKDTDGTTCLIKNAYQMDLVRNYLGISTKTFKLANNIDLSPVQYGQTQRESGSWKPIGTIISKFDGTFDGNGHSVSGIYIKSNDSSLYLGLFGYEDTGSKIQNVGVTNDSIANTSHYGAPVGGAVGQADGAVTDCYNTGVVSNYSYVGGVVGNSVGTVTSCYNTGAVSGSSQVGGVAGCSFATVTSCYNTGTVSGSSQVGGIVGSSGATVTNCYNTGAVSGSVVSVGGVVGDSSGTVTNCYNTGAVSGSGTGIGGIAGNSTEAVTSCYNAGTISGSSQVGGIAGSSGATVTNCYNTGAVSGSTKVGGVAGSSFAAVTSCYNTGAISGSSGVGGIAADSRGTVTSCYNTGAVSGSLMVGGIAGSSAAAVTSCYNTGTISGDPDVSGNSDVGGVAGVSMDEIEICYNTGAVSGSSSSVGGVVGNNYGTVSNNYYSGHSGGVGQDGSAAADVAGTIPFVSCVNPNVGESKTIKELAVADLNTDFINAFHITAIQYPDEYESSDPTVLTVSGRTVTRKVNGGATVTGTAGANSNAKIILSQNALNMADAVSGFSGAGTAAVSGPVTVVFAGQQGGTNKQLTGIIAPINISDTAGTPKTADGLHLPATVSLVTDQGNVDASVTWDVNSCAYDPSQTTEQTFTVRGTVTLPAGVTNPNSMSLAISISVTVGASSGAPVINTASALPNGTLNTPYSQTLTAAGTAPITWALASGSLPGGLSLSIDGIISGTPTAVGSYSFTVTAANSSGQTTVNMSIQITAASSGAPVINTASALPGGTVNTPYSQTLTAAGTAPITWALASGSSLPDGLTLSDGGVISGTPTAAGSYSFTVTAANSSGQTTENMSIQITGGGTPASSATVTGFDPLIDAVKNQTAAIGEAVASLNLPQKLKVAVVGMGELWVKVSGWVSNTFNSSVFSKAGTYIFTPVLNNAYHDSGYVDSGYTVASGTSWPSITVTVQNNSSGGHSSNTGSSSSSAASSQTTQTQVDAATNTATVTTVPDSVTNAGGTAQISITVPSVTGGAGGTLDPGKAEKVTISLPENVMVQQLNAKQNVDLTLSVPSSVAHQTNGNTAIDIPVGSDVFAAAKASGSDLVINIKDTDTQKLAYTWTFKGSDLAKSTTPVTDVNIGMAIRLTTEVPQVNRLTPSNTGLVLMFDHSGVLPSTASLTFNAKEKGFKPGQKLYFYFYNTAAGQLESQAQEYTVDADGNVTVQINHCSNYVLLPNKARTITLDTRVYTMPVGDSYITGVKLTGVSGAKLRVYSSTKGVADVTALSNGNVKAKALKTGLTYVMIDVYDSKNKFLTHASVRLIVKEVKPNGNSARQFGIF